MRYFLTSPYPLRGKQVEISADDFELLSSATKSITTVLYAEQKFDILVENYVELESSLMQTSIKHMVHESYELRFFNEQRDLLNRLLSNLLSAARAYIDFMPQAAHRAFGHGTTPSALCEKAPASAYDEFFGYRVMEGLRNYTQHQGLPVEALRFTGDAEGENTRVVVSFYALRERLRELKVFRTRVQDELDAEKKAGLDLKRMTREYMSGLAQVHGIFREQVALLMPVWVAHSTNAVRLYKSQDDQVHDYSVGLLDESKGPRFFVHLALSQLEHFNHLLKKNGSVGRLHKQYVSGQLVPEEPGEPFKKA